MSVLRATHSSIRKGRSMVQKLKISMTLRRREYGGKVGKAIQVKVKDMQLNWHMFLFFLDDGELRKSRDIGQMWGEQLTGAMH